MKMVLRWTMAILVLIWANGAFAMPIVYTAQLDGASEDPANASPATGFAEIDFDIVAHFLTVNLTFSDLLGTTTASHIHSPTALPGIGTAGVATELPSFAGFPFGVTSGSYMHTFDMTLTSTWNPAFITANGGTPGSAEAALDASLAAGTAYLNIHTSVVPSGEIRGFLAPASVPEPSTLFLMGTGLAGVGILRRRFRR